MASASILKDRRSARLASVERHIRLENAHDLEGVISTFGDTARYDDEPWGEHYTGRDGIRLFYEQLMKALPDLEIEVQCQHVTDDAVLVEVMIRGTHLGVWRRVPSASSHRLLSNLKLTGAVLGTCRDAQAHDQGMPGRVAVKQNCRTANE